MIRADHMGRRKPGVGKELHGPGTRRKGVVNTSGFHGLGFEVRSPGSVLCHSAWKPTRPPLN